MRRRMRARISKYDLAPKATFSLARRIQVNIADTWVGQRLNETVPRTSRSLIVNRNAMRFRNDTGIPLISLYNGFWYSGVKRVI